MNFKTKKILFFNHTGLNLINKANIDEIKNKFIISANMKISDKNYHFLNEKNLYHLKNGNYNIMYNTFGQKYFLFITKIDEKKYIFFINRKNENIVIFDSIYLKDDELFMNTILDGEIIKNNDNHTFHYIINDIIVYKNKNITNSKTFVERKKIIDDIISKNYIINMVNKEYHTLHYINDLYIGHSKSIYKISGLIFINNNAFKSFIYIFTEYRTAAPVIQPSVRIKEVTTTQIITNKSNFNFLIKCTELPDVYELYCYDKNKNIVRYDYACIQKLDTSKFLSNAFKHNNENIIVECRFTPEFNKWTPVKLSSNDIDIL